MILTDACLINWEIVHSTQHSVAHMREDNNYILVKFNYK